MCIMYRDYFVTEPHYYLLTLGERERRRCPLSTASTARRFRLVCICVSAQFAREEEASPTGRSIVVHIGARTEKLALRLKHRLVLVVELSGAISLSTEPLAALPLRCDRVVLPRKPQRSSRTCWCCLHRLRLLRKSGRT